MTIRVPPVPLHVYDPVSSEKDLLVNQVAELQRVCEALLLSQMQVGSWCNSKTAKWSCMLRGLKVPQCMYIALYMLMKYRLAQPLHYYQK